MLKPILTLSLISFLLASFTFAQDIETRNFKDFTELEVSGTIKVKLVKAEVNEAEIEVIDADFSELETYVRGNTLKISWKNKRSMQNSWDEDQPKAYLIVKYKELNEISTAAAAMVKTEGPIETESFELDASSASQCELEVICTELEVEVSSAAKVEMSGKAQKQDIMVTSVGRYEGYDMITEESEVEASSIGKAYVFSTQKIEASATSMGSVKFKGSPDEVKIDESSLGSISER